MQREGRKRSHLLNWHGTNQCENGPGGDHGLHRCSPGLWWAEGLSPQAGGHLPGHRVPASEPHRVCAGVLGNAASDSAGVPVPLLHGSKFAQGSLGSMCKAFTVVFGVVCCIPPRLCVPLAIIGHQVSFDVSMPPQKLNPRWCRVQTLAFGFRLCLQGRHFFKGKKHYKALAIAVIIV